MILPASLSPSAPAEHGDVVQVEPVARRVRHEHFAALVGVERFVQRTARGLVVGRAFLIVLAAGALQAARRFGGARPAGEHRCPELVRFGVFVQEPGEVASGAWPVDTGCLSFGAIGGRDVRAVVRVVRVDLGLARARDLTHAAQTRAAFVRREVHVDTHRRHRAVIGIEPAVAEERFGDLWIERSDRV